jgi:hypothetical protein
MLTSLLKMSSIRPRRGERAGGEDLALVREPDNPAPHRHRRDKPYRMLLHEQLDLAPQGCKAAGLDLDQQVAADEVDDETAGDLLEQVAGTAVPFLQLRVERALVERPDLHDDAPSARCRVACACTRIGSCASTTFPAPARPASVGADQHEEGKVGQKFVAFLDDMTERESRPRIPGQAARCEDVAREQGVDEAHARSRVRPVRESPRHAR